MQSLTQIGQTVWTLGLANKHRISALYVWYTASSLLSIAGIVSVMISIRNNYTIKSRKMSNGRKLNTDCCWARAMPISIRLTENFDEIDVNFGIVNKTLTTEANNNAKMRLFLYLSFLFYFQNEKDRNISITNGINALFYWSRTKFT